MSAESAPAPKKTLTDLFDELNERAAKERDRDDARLRDGQLHIAEARRAVHAAIAAGVGHPQIQKASESLAIVSDAIEIALISLRPKS